MGMIQNSINQMIGTAGIAARLDPNAETRAELARIKNTQEKVQKQRESMPENLQPGTQEYQILELAEEEGAKLAQKRFELDPTPETLKEAAIARPFLTKNAMPSAQSLKLKQMMANEDSKGKTAVKQSQKREYKSFKKALMSQPEVAALGEKARQAVYEQTKGNKAFREEVISKHYGNK